MSTPLLILTYCLLIVLASLVGGWIPQWIQLTHKRMELAISAIAGFMLGVGLLHMLPHAQEAIGNIHHTVLWLLAGFLAMFFIERFFRYHHHEVPESDAPGSDDPMHIEIETAAPSETTSTHSNVLASSRPAAHSHDHDHSHCDHPSHAHDHGHSHGASGHKLSWSGAAIGLSLHSILDGIALAAAASTKPIVVAGQADVAGPAWAGLAVFLVVFLHRPFDSMTLVTLMAKGGWSARTRQIVNGLFSLAIPVGAALFVLGLSGTSHQNSLVGCALAFSAGTFLCISTSDLLPELQFHQHDRVPLSVLFLLGLALAWGVAQVDTHDEAEHHDEASHVDEHGHNHGHDHGNSHSAETDHAP